MKTSVSVIIPTYNSQGTIARALSSVFAQTWQPLEIIVVDDGSLDKTVSVIKELISQSRSNLLTIVELHSNHGPSYARNVGWDMASGEFLAFLDADDSWHPKKLEIQAGYMAEHNEFALTAHRCVFLSENKPAPLLSQEWETASISAWHLMISYQFFTPSVILRTEIPYRFDPQRRYSEDRLLWLELVFNGYRAARLELPLAYLHKHPWGEGGLSGNLWEMEKGELDLFTRLRRSGFLNRTQEIAFKSWSFLKFMRRLLVSWRRKRVA